MNHHNLSELRRQIADITFDIMRLTSERMRLSRLISEKKQALQLPVEDPEVERSMKNNLVQEINEKKLDLDTELALRLTNLLVDESIKAQKIVRVTKGHTTSEFFVRALELERLGNKVYHLELGEPDFELPGQIIELCVKALENGRFKYTDPQGLLEVREKICGYLEEKRGVDFRPDQVLFTSGGRMAVAWGIGAVTPPGGEVIVIEPAWPGYRQAIEFFGGKYVPIHTSLEKEWELEIEEITKAVNLCTRAIVINQPSNPTGATLSRDVLTSLARIAKAQNLWILADEVYSDFVYGGRFESALNLDCHVMYVGSFSKSLGLTGFRAGYLVANKEIIDRALKFQTATLTCAPEFIQVVCGDTLDLEANVKRNVDIMLERVNQSYAKLSKAPELEVGKPGGGFYLFPRLKGGRDGEAFTSELLQKRHVSITPGVTFGAYPDCFRVSVCTKGEDLREGIGRIVTAASESY